MRIHARRQTQPELGVVLEEGVRPCGSATGSIDAPRRRREIAAVDRRASRGVCDQEAVAEQLRQELEVRRLTATGAGPRELEERLGKLRALDVGGDPRPVHLRKVEEELEVSPLAVTDIVLRLHVDRLPLGIRLVAAGTDLNAQVAAGAVVGSDLDRVEEPGVVVRLERLRLERGRRARPAPRARRAWPGSRRAGRRSRTCCTGCRTSGPRSGSPPPGFASPTSRLRSARFRREETR